MGDRPDLPGKFGTPGKRDSSSNTHREGDEGEGRSVRRWEGSGEDRTRNRENPESPPVKAKTEK